MTKLSIKQLYGYSIMKWNKLQENLSELNELLYSHCSFCIDSNISDSKKVHYCKINQDICNCFFHNIGYNPITTNFNDICIAFSKLYIKMNLIIEVLTKEYNSN